MYKLIWLNVIIDQWLKYRRAWRETQITSSNPLGAIVHIYWNNFVWKSYFLSKIIIKYFVAYLTLYILLMHYFIFINQVVFCWYEKLISKCSELLFNSQYNNRYIGRRSFGLFGKKTPKQLQCNLSTLPFYKEAPLLR